MGFTPATGNEISIGCVYGAFGLVPFPGANIGLNSVLGVNRQPPQAAGVTAIPAGVETELSVDMGGLDTPNEYNCAVNFTALILCTDSGSVGWNSDSAACEGICNQRTVYVSQSGITSFQQAAITFGLSLYSGTTFIPANEFDGNSKWFKSVSGEVFQVDADGGMSLFGVCPSPTPTPTNTPTPPVTPSNTPTPPVTPTNTPTPSVTPPLYYTLNGCTGQPLYDTTITPILSSQRYVDPVSGTFWVWDNAPGTSSPQQTVNSSLQIVSGQSGCP
jgi:hypothetical protein